MPKPETTSHSHGSLCPWWLGWTLNNSLRRLLHKPERILAGQDAGEVLLDSRREPKVCQALATYRWNDPRSTIANVSHAYHFVWKDFAGWAAENGLRPELEYQHDGGGMHSWHALKVHPIA